MTCGESRLNLSYLVVTYERSHVGEDIAPPEEASMRKQWTMKVARALFAIKVRVDDDILEYLMNVKTQNEAWDIYV